MPAAETTLPALYTKLATPSAGRRKEVVQIFLAANGMALPMAPAGETILDPQEVAERVAPATLLVECR